MIRLITVDVGHTLGEFTGPTVEQVLGPLTRTGGRGVVMAGSDPLTGTPDHVIREESRRLLHVSPTATPEVVEEMCGRLLIDPADWPDPWPSSGFEAYPGVAETLAELAAIAPVVTLSNVPCTSGPDRMVDLVDQLGDHLTAVYTSYGERQRKPHPVLWRTIADRHGVEPCEIVHIGDRWLYDVRGPLAAGCRAVWTGEEVQEFVLATLATLGIPSHHVAAAWSINDVVPLLRDSWVNLPALPAGRPR